MLLYDSIMKNLIRSSLIKICTHSFLGVSTFLNTSPISEMELCFRIKTVSSYGVLQHLGLLW